MLCVLCRSKAICGLEMCVKMLRELCELCERKKIPSASPFVAFSGNTTSNPFESIVYIRKAVTSDEVTACVCLRDKSLTSR